MKPLQLLSVCALLLMVACHKKDNNTVAPNNTNTTVTPFVAYTEAYAGLYNSTLKIALWAQDTAADQIFVNHISATQISLSTPGRVQQKFDSQVGLGSTYTYTLNDQGKYAYKNAADDQEWCTLTVTADSVIYNGQGRGDCLDGPRIYAFRGARH